LRAKLEILNMIHIGKTNKEIAEAFGLSVRTIETHGVEYVKELQTSSLDEV